MFDIKKAYGFDKGAAEKGAKMIVGKDQDKDFILICRMPNDNYRARLSELMEANHEYMQVLKTQDKKAYDKLNTDLMTQVISETIITGWGEGFGEDGNSIPYSVATCVDFMERYPDFRIKCVNFAGDQTNYPLKPSAKTAKKS